MGNLLPDSVLYMYFTKILVKAAPGMVPPAIYGKHANLGVI